MEKKFVPYVQKLVTKSKPAKLRKLSVTIAEENILPEANFAQKTKKQSEITAIQSKERVPRGQAEILYQQRNPNPEMNFAGAAARGLSGGTGGAAGQTQGEKVQGRNDVPRKRTRTNSDDENNSETSKHLNVTIDLNKT